MTAPNGSIGVDLAIDPDGGNVQNFHLSNLHIERFETGLRLSGVDNVVVDAPVITGPDGGLDGILIEGADRICQGVFINVPFIKAFQTQQSTGTGIRLTNHAHNRIVIRRPIISDVDARISNAATGPLNEIRDENPTYTITNYDTDRSYNAGSTSVAELADVLGTLINDLRTKGIVA
jgi:hypothetical protein